jgi:hypothetical protein
MRRDRKLLSIVTVKHYLISTTLEKQNGHFGSVLYIEQTLTSYDNDEVLLDYQLNISHLVVSVIRKVWYSESFSLTRRTVKFGTG